MSDTAQGTGTGAGTAADVVGAFIGALERNDLDTALGLVTPDVVYDNVPIGAVNGPDGIRSVLDGFLGSFDGIEWRIVHQVASSSIVMNERVDRFRRGDTWLELAVAGVFEVVDGRIRLWRDYFDMAAFQRTFAPPS